MRMFLIVVGLTTIGLAGIAAAQPERLITLTRRLWQKPAAFFLAVALRTLVGVALMMIAPASRFPDAFYLLGLITVAAAIVGLLIGRHRMSRFVEWWFARPTPFLRVWASVAAIFGAFLIYGVV